MINKSNLKEIMMKKYAFALAVAGVVLAGCGDSAYNCDNENVLMSAIMIKNGLDVNDEKDISKVKNALKSFNTSIELLRINDEDKESFCNAKLTAKKAENKSDMKKIMYSAGVIENTSEKDMDAIINRLIENNVSISDFNKRMKQNATYNLHYRAYDNGRGDTYIEIQR